MRPGHGPIFTRRSYSTRLDLTYIREQQARKMQPDLTRATKSATSGFNVPGNSCFHSSAAPSDMSCGAPNSRIHVSYSVFCLKSSYSSSHTSIQKHPSKQPVVPKLPSVQDRLPCSCSATNSSHGIAIEARAARDSIPTACAALVARLTPRAWPATIKSGATRDGIATVLALSAARRADGAWPAAEESGAARVAVAAVLGLPDAALLHV